MSDSPLRVAFLHPDLGIGGAERLVVDAAVELVACGHHVDIFTPYYNPSHSFEETRSGTFGVHVAGGWFPRSLMGRTIALCAYIRCLLAAVHVIFSCWLGTRPNYDVFIVDQVSFVVPFLQVFTDAKVLFYCHFPDLLLARPASALHRAYRAPLDFAEELSTGCANLVLVNSAFTAGVFADTFKRLEWRGVRPRVLHPAVVVPPAAELQDAAARWAVELEPTLVDFLQRGPMLLSINRFERKKGIGLALEALAALAAKPTAGSGGTAHSLPVLVLAGGYDVRLAENVEYLAELRAQAQRLGLADRVTFVPSFTDRQRALLLSACTAVLYTPQHEHFGIVPLEAMAAGRPVIAVNNGGPVETVRDGDTGFLCEPTARAFADALRQLLGGQSVARRMGVAARAHVEARFSRGAFGRKLDGFVRRLAVKGRGQPSAMVEGRRGLPPASAQLPWQPGQEYDTAQ